jgi:hypothetical protein
MPPAGRTSKGIRLFEVEGMVCGSALTARRGRTGSRTFHLRQQAAHTTSLSLAIARIHGVPRDNPFGNGENWS